MVKKLAVCDNCDYKGVADVIEMEGRSDEQILGLSKLRQAAHK